MVLCCGLPAAIRAVEPAAPRKETWQSIALRGQRIGYGHVVETRVEDHGRTVVVTDMRLHTVMKRFDGKLTLIIDQQVREELNGDLLSFTFRMDNPPASRMEMTGRVEGAVLKLQTTAGGKSTDSELSAPRGTKSPVFVDRLLEETPLKQTEERTISLFDPQLGAVVSVRAVGKGPAEHRLPDGELQPGSLVSIEYLSGIPGLAVDCYFDVHGRSVLNEAKLLGTTTWNVSQQEALAEIPADIDIGLTALIKVPPIADARRTREVEYRIRLPNGVPERLIPAGPLQSVARHADGTVTVTVKSVRPGSAASTSAQTSDEKYLAATAMARSDDEAIVELAAAASPPTAAPAEVAKGLELRVHEWLHRKNMSTNMASASEVVRSREGDCTEHAVLLTALLRARKIPARVAVGVVYWEPYSAFAGHAWTEAWLNGEWIPLDATQAEGGVAADRIKLADSSLADGDTGVIAGSIATWQLLDQAQIEVLRIQAAETQ